MAEKTKTLTDIEEADGFYKSAMAYKSRIEKWDAILAKSEETGEYKEYREEKAKAIEAMKALGNLSEAQEEMIASYSNVVEQYQMRADVIAKKEEDLQCLSAIEGEIKIAISKYIVDTEKEQKKLEKDKEKYAGYVEKEKNEYEELKAKVEEMDKDDVTYEDEVAKLENKKNEIERMDKKLASIDEDLAKITEELNKNKEKYKDYIDLAKEDLPVPEEPEEEKGDAEGASKEATETEAKEPVEEKEEEDPVEGEDLEENEQKTGPATKEKRTRMVENPGVVYVMPEDIEGPKTEKTQAEEKEKSSEKEVEEETDKQAFKRIYKALKKKEELSSKDMEKMLDIIGDKDNFDKYNITTTPFLPFFKSKGEKIYTNLGKELDRQMRGAIKNEELLQNFDTEDITSWDYINELGNNNPGNNILETLDKAIESSDEKETDKIEALKNFKNLYEKYRASTKTLIDVKKERGEYRLKKAKALPPEMEGELHKPEVETADKTKGLDELSKMVRSDTEITEKDVAASTETPEKTVEVTTEENII